MNQIIKLHSEAIEEDTGLYTAYSVKTKEGKFVPVCSIQKAATKSAEITEQIAIEFLRYYHQTAELSFHITGHNQGKSHSEVYQQFLIERQ